MFFKKNKTQKLPIKNINKQKVLFIHINKTGGTSILKALGFHQKIHMTVRHLEKHFENTEINQFYKFSFVRNPWDKVYSHYKYRVKTNQCNMKKRPIQFNEWVKRTYGPHKDYYYFDNTMMFQPQLEWLKNHRGEQKMDFIGRFETINDDFNKLCNDLNIETKLPHLNATSEKSYKQQFNEETKEIVGEWFQQDIEYFNYSF